MTDGRQPSVGPEHLRAFRDGLLRWFEAHRRDLPWREEDEDGSRNPYHVWLAEVMLQQTRVDQALPYFERFTAAFPTLLDLAEADLDEVLRAWEGLGYYRRARNLHAAVREVAHSYGGTVPADERSFAALPGVGPYTTAAVLSLAFGRPLAAVDGNVTRVLARVFAIDDDVARSSTKRHLARLAAALLDPDRPGPFNEAMMELGATVCTPRGPRCEDCPLAGVCQARAAGRPEDFPVAARRAPVPHLDVAVAIIENGEGRVLIQQRPLEAMLGGLWEFPGGKVIEGETPAEACRREVAEEVGLEIALGEALGPVRHAYSHFRITLHAFRARSIDPAAEPQSTAPLAWVLPEEFDVYAFPRANRLVIEQLHAHRSEATL